MNFFFDVADYGRDLFNQNFRKFRSKTQWIGSLQPEKFRKNRSTFWAGPLFPVGPVCMLVEWIAPYELFSVHDPLSDEKSNLKISYVNKTFQKKPEHYCSPHEIFFANDLFYVKNTECNLRIATRNRITVLIVRILRERAVICGNVFFFLLKLSNRTVDFLHFRLYSVSNILEQNHSQRRSWQTEVTK